jgi:hypothetical protein
MPHNTDSKNLLEHPPPRWQEHPGTNDNAMEAPTDLYELTFSSLGPTGHVNLLQNIKVASLELSDRCTVYKRPPYPSGRGYDEIISSTS